MKARLKQQLLIVNGKMRQDYEEYLDLIPTEQHTEMNWLHQDFLPTLILLPSLCKQRENTEAVALASMLELSYMAHQVHSQAPAEGTPDDYRMPILIGDYLLATALHHLIADGNTKWLNRLGQAFCRMNEGKTVRSQWNERTFVPLDQKVENLQKEYGELAALAGLMGADAAGFNPEETQIYTAFSYYAGVLQGILLHHYHEEKPAILEEYIDYCEQYLFMLPTDVKQDLQTLFLDKLLAFSDFHFESQKMQEIRAALN